MKTNLSFNAKQLWRLVVIAGLLINCVTLSAQICTDPANVIYGLTNSANIHPITVSTGAVAARINPAYGGSAPSFANAMGYNNLNGKMYYFKRNINASPQEFISFDPATNMVVKLADCPSTTIVNLGCITANGLGYYCMDAQGKLYYYNIVTNLWTTVASSVKDQSGNSLAMVIVSNTRVMGDFAIDGSGNLWIVISGDDDYGLYRMSAPLPTTPVVTANVVRYLAPTTPTPSGVSFGGIAFNNTGQIFMSTNSGDNKLYRMETNLSLTYLSTMTLDGIGNDLTSCNFPLALLPFTVKNFVAKPVNDQRVSLSWTDFAQSTSGYEVEHSMDGLKWEKISYVRSQQANTSSENYTYAHDMPVNGKNFYRVKTISIDGATSYSDTKTVDISSKNSISIWPNPAQDYIKVKNLNSVNGSTAVLSIIDKSGRKISEQNITSTTNSLDIRTLSPGIYFIQVKFSNGTWFNEKIVKL